MKTRPMADEYLLAAIHARRENNMPGVRQQLVAAIEHGAHSQICEIIAFCYPNMQLPLDESTEQLLQLACLHATDKIVFDMTLYMSPLTDSPDFAAESLKLVQILERVRIWLEPRNVPDMMVAITDALRDLPVLPRTVAAVQPPEPASVSAPLPQPEPEPALATPQRPSSKRIRQPPKRFRPE